MKLEQLADVRLPHVNEPRPDIARWMIARALAEAFRDTLDAPLPKPVEALLRQIEERERHG